MNPGTVSPDGRWCAPCVGEAIALRMLPQDFKDCLEELKADAGDLKSALDHGTKM